MEKIKRLLLIILLIRPIYLLAARNISIEEMTEDFFGNWYIEDANNIGYFESA